MLKIGTTNDEAMPMDDVFESLYLLILLLILWGLSFVIGMMMANDLMMVLFFWVASVITIIVYSLIYRIKKKDVTILKRELLLLIPIWLFLIYQSYYTVKSVQMSTAERWALIPFVLGLGFYLAFLKQSLDKKEKQ